MIRGVLGILLGASALALASPALAAERAYELVTPPRSEAEVRHGGGLSTADGETVCFNAEESFAGAPENGNTTFDDGYCARRTASGWETEWVTGPAPSGPRRGNFGSNVFFLAPDGARVAFASDAGIFPDWGGDVPESPRWGTRSAFMHEAGQTRWLAPAPDPLPEMTNAFDNGFALPRQPLAASDDLRHGIFQSTLRLVAEDQNDSMDVYEWTPDGIRLVSRDASGSAIGGYAPLGGDAEQRRPAPGSVSVDGSRVFFMVPAEGGPTQPFGDAPAGVLSVFMREGDELTHVSPRRGPGPAADVRMDGAYAGGSVVYLSTSEQMTNEPKADCAAPPCDALYRYDVEDDELSLFASHADGIAFLGASEDGETVLYRTNGGSQELLVRRGGVESSLGVLAPLDTTALFDVVGTVRPDKRALRIAADGSAIAFASFAGFDGAPFMSRQVFRWTPAGGVKWVSRDAAGTAMAGLAALGNYSTKFPAGLPRYTQFDIYSEGGNSGRVMTEDGSRVFFETQDPLVEGDDNGKIDVYEWEDGEVSLVSPGTQTEDAFYHDNSADGSTVFFITRSRLIPELDRGTARDLYAARVGGGFPLPEEPPECVGEECQGPPPGSRPPATPPGSDAAQRSGDADQRRVAPRFSLAPLAAKQRRALAEGRRAKLRVRVDGAGRVRAIAVARIGSRRTRVAQAARVALREGTVPLTLRLSNRARAALEKRGALRLSLQVTHSKSKRIVRKVVVLHD